MAKQILVANWKNHPDSLRATNALLAGISRKRALYKQISLYIAPSPVYFESVSKKIAGFSNLASQDFPSVLEGTHTGIVTLDILKSFGVKLAIIGHSEMRALGETSKEVSKKVKLALKSGIVPVLCVGERIRDEEGEYLGVLRQEIKLSLEDLKKGDDVHKLMIAYEPVWAVGKKSKDAVSPDDLAQAVIFIRKILTDMFGRDTAEKITILYGGSVNPKNIKSLASGTGIKGFLVGRASLDAKQLEEMVKELTT